LASKSKTGLGLGNKRTCGVFRDQGGELSAGLQMSFSLPCGEANRASELPQLDLRGKERGKGKGEKGRIEKNTPAK